MGKEERADHWYGDQAHVERIVRTLTCDIDGGGIRGLSSLLIMEALMREIARLELLENPQFDSSADSPLRFLETTKSTPRTTVTEEDVKAATSKCLPCHYFDFIAGTSTGG
jgi:hypothetical protein